MRPFICILAFSLCVSGCRKKEARTDPAKLRQEVVQRVESRAIAPDSQGMAVLPDGFKSITPDGKVFVVKDSTLGWAVIFNNNEWSPEKNIQGLLYTQNLINEAVKRVRVGPLQLNLRLPSGSHWYLVDNRPE